MKNLINKSKLWLSKNIKHVTLAFYLISAALIAYIFDGLIAAIASSFCVAVGVIGFLFLETDNRIETDEHEDNHL